VRAQRAHPATLAVADCARRVLGDARAKRYLDPAGAMLESNRDVQVTVFLATQMYLAALAAEAVTAEHSVGLSLGEYSHLVHIGSLDLDAALGLVDERGRCYDTAPAGRMTTILAVDREAVATIVGRAEARGTVVISNYNARTQHVIAGAADAVDWAAVQLEQEYCAHTTVIEQRVPMHSPLMAPVAQRFAPSLASAAFRPPVRAYRPNVTGAALPGATREDIVSCLTRHVSEPVRWQDAIDGLVAEHPDAAFIEVGPGRALHNMMGRDWRKARRLRIDAADQADPHEHFSATVQALRA